MAQVLGSPLYICGNIRTFGRYIPYQLPGKQTGGLAAQTVTMIFILRYKK